MFILPSELRAKYFELQMTGLERLHKSIRKQALQSLDENLSLFEIERLKKHITKKILMIRCFMNEMQKSGS